jgi:hypothetical protein
MSRLQSFSCSIAHRPRYEPPGLRGGERSRTNDYFGTMLPSSTSTITSAKEGPLGTGQILRLDDDDERIR